MKPLLNHPYYQAAKVEQMIPYEDQKKTTNEFIWKAKQQRWKIAGRRILKSQPRKVN